jgi:hypothetical protein
MEQGSDQIFVRLADLSPAIMVGVDDAFGSDSSMVGNAFADLCWGEVDESPVAVRVATPQSIAEDTRAMDEQNGNGCAACAAQPSLQQHPHMTQLRCFDCAGKLQQCPSCQSQDQRHSLLPTANVRNLLPPRTSEMSHSSRIAQSSAACSGKDQVLRPHPSLNPFQRPPSDFETSDPVVREQVVGASACAFQLQTIKQCDGVNWDAFIRFSTQLPATDVNLDVFGRPNLDHSQSVEVLLQVVDPAGNVRTVPFRGRLYNSNRKKKNPGLLTLQFKGVKNENLVYLNHAARCIRQFIDVSVAASAAPGEAPPARPTYQLLFHGTSMYGHAKLSPDDVDALQSKCQSCDGLRHLEFERKKSPLCKLKQFNGGDATVRGDPCFTVEVYPTRFKVTERYEDQDMSVSSMVHKHSAVVDELRGIIEQLGQSKRHAAGECSSNSTRQSDGGLSAMGGGAAAAASGEHQEFEDEDDVDSFVNDPDVGDAPDLHEDFRVCKRSRCP